MSESREDYQFRTGDDFSDADGTTVGDGGATGEDTETEVVAEAIVADIEVTRGEMSETIEAIGARLEPQAMMDNAKQSVRDATVGRVENMVQSATETAQDATGGIVETIRSNPIPAAMTGIGLFMLWQAANRGGGGGRSQRQVGYRAYGGGYAGEYDQAYGTTYSGGGGGGGGGFQQTAGSAVGRAQETAGNVVGTAQQTAGNVVGTAQQTAGNVVGTAQQTAGNVIGTAQQTAGNVIGTAQQTAGNVIGTAQQAASRAPGQIQRVVQENPLGAGLVAVAVGATAALALPTTRKEQEMYGRPRDAAIEKAQQQVETVIDRAEESMSSGGGSA